MVPALVETVGAWAVGRPSAGAATPGRPSSSHGTPWLKDSLTDHVCAEAQVVLLQVENVGAWAAGRPSPPGRYGSIDTNGADFLAASELHLAGLSEVQTSLLC